MAEEAKPYFELWLDEKLDSRRKRAQLECSALDRKAMAANPRWYYDGRRVHLTANIISDIFLPLIDKVLDKAMEYPPQSVRVETAASALTKLLEEFSALAVQAAKSTIMGKAAVPFEQSRTYSATIELIEPLRRRMLVKMEGARRSARAVAPNTELISAGSAPKAATVGRRLTRHERGLFKVHGADAYRRELEADPQKVRTERGDWEFFKERFGERFPRALAVEIRNALNPKLRKTGGVPASTPVRIKSG